MKRLVIISCLFFGSIFFVVILYRDSHYLNSRPNGFIRLFPPHILTPFRSLNLGVNSFYVCGAVNHKIYFANLMSPALIIVTNSEMMDTIHKMLSIPGNTKLIEGSFKLSIDNSNIRMIDGRTGAYLLGKLEDFKLHLLTNDIPLYQSIPLSPGSVLGRIFDSLIKQDVIVKASTYAPLYPSRKFVLDNDGDGIFSVDGMFNYNQTIHKAYFIYYYRNKIVCLDTNLNTLYKATTIDTTSYSNLKVSYIQSSNSTTLAAPPLKVNSKSCVSEKWIFVNSLLKATNETSAEFRKHHVIDIYDNVDGRYKFSAYIESDNNKKISSMYAFDNKLIVICDDQAMLYHLNF